MSNKNLDMTNSYSASVSHNDALNLSLLSD